jgi:hypothetical protein
VHQIEKIVEVGAPSEERVLDKLDDLVKILPTLREAAALDDTTEIPVDLLRHVDEAGPPSSLAYFPPPFAHLPSPIFHLPSLLPPLSSLLSPPISHGEPFQLNCQPSQLRPGFYLSLKKTRAITSADNGDASHSSAPATAGLRPWDGDAFNSSDTAGRSVRPWSPGKRPQRYMVDGLLAVGAVNEAGRQHCPTSHRSTRASSK